MLDSVRFEGRRSEPIKNQLGFRKGHSIPDRVDSSVQQFVTLVTQEALAAELQKLFGKLRTAFPFKRSALQVEEFGDGTGTIRTPLFQYSLSAEQDVQVASNVVWMSVVDRITDSKAVQSEAFGGVFDSHFDSLIFRAKRPIDLEAIVDAVEDAEDDRVGLTYDYQMTECRLTLEGVPGKIIVNARELKLEHHSTTSPARLIHTFASLQRVFLSNDGIQTDLLESFFANQ